MANIPTIIEVSIQEQIITSFHHNGSYKLLHSDFIDKQSIRLDIELNFYANDTRIFVHNLKLDLSSIFAIPLADIEVNLTQRALRHVVRENIKPHKQIKNIIAVSSAKGGVGKSTTAANLALSLHHLGAKVGILDADIYGPSQPKMLGCEVKADIVGKSFIPVTSHNIPMISIGNLVEESSAMIWRGPMVSGALKQLLNDTHWPELDYLIVDLPPGTGDIQLTMLQKLPLTAAIIVTTPQDIALTDAKRGIEMFNKLDIPLLGVVENMAAHICEKCGHSEKIFGNNTEKLLKEYSVDLLGSLPLNIKIRESSDNGKPVVLADNTVIKSSYVAIAGKVSLKLSNLKVENRLLNVQQVTEE